MAVLNWAEPKTVPPFDGQNDFVQRHCCSCFAAPGQCRVTTQTGARATTRRQLPLASSSSWSSSGRAWRVAAASPASARTCTPICRCSAAYSSTHDHQLSPSVPLVSVLFSRQIKQRSAAELPPCRPCDAGRTFWGWGSWPLKICRRGQSVFWLPKISHSFIQNCCWITR